MCGLKKRHMFKRNWIMSSRFVDLSRFDCQQNLGGGWGSGDLYDHLMSTNIFTLMLKKVFI